MIILRTRSYMNKEDLLEASEMYAMQAANGVLVLPENIDIVRVPEVIKCGYGVLVEGGPDEEDPISEEATDEEEPVMQQ